MRDPELVARAQRAEFLDRDECVQRGQIPVQRPPVQPVPLQAGPLQSGPLQQVPLTEQFASWPPGGPLAADQPPAGA